MEPLGLKEPLGQQLFLYGVTYGNGLFVVVGRNGTILTSSDGISWTSRTSGTSNSLGGVTYGNGTFVTVGYSITSSSTSTSDNSTPTITTEKSTTTLTSSDGVTWTLRDSGTSNELRGKNHIRERTIRDGGLGRNPPHLFGWNLMG